MGPNLYHPTCSREEALQKCQGVILEEGRLQNVSEAEEQWQLLG